MPVGVYDHSKNPSLFRKGHKVNVGSKRSPETREKLRLQKLGEKNPRFGKKWTPEYRDKIIPKLRGKKSDEHRANIKAGVKRGENHHNWKGGITPVNRAIRNSPEYKLWRKAVLERDNHTCIWCFRDDLPVQADHIKPFSLFPELRFAIDNGRTLCVPCHETTKTFGGRSLKKKV